LGHVITDDEIWVYQYDTEMKRQCAMEDCQFPYDQNNSISPNQESRNVFLKEEKVTLTKRDQDSQQQAELKNNCA
jgi:hypothetical protein